MNNIQNSGNFDDRPGPSGYFPKKSIDINKSQNYVPVSGLLEQPFVESIFIYMPVPPDGGYAWIILLISFTITACIDGMLLSAGSVLDTVATDLGFTTSEITSLSSVQNAVYLFSGPVVCAVANNVGFRIPAIIGGLTAGIGLLTGSFCSDWLGLLFSYGFLVGLGFGFISSPNSLIVGHYFDKYRPVAFGISSSGVGAGTIIFSFLNIFLLKNLSWRNTIRVYFVICIFLSAISFLFRPIKAVNIKKIERLLEDADSIESESIEAVLVMSKFTRYDEDFAKIETIESRQSITAPEPTFSDSRKNRFLSLCRCCRRKIPEQEEEDIPKSNENIPTKFVIEKRPLFREDIFLDTKIPYQSQQKDEISMATESRTQRQSIRATSRLTEDIRQSMIKSNLRRGQDHRISQVASTLKIYSTKSGTKFTTDEEKNKFNIKNLFRIPPAIKRGFNLLFDISIFESKSIRVYLASSFFLMLANIIPFLFAQKQGLVNGIPKEITNWFITTLGITNLVFRMLGGLFVTFTKNVNPIYVPATCLLFSGCFTFLSGLIGQESIPFQFIWLIFFGIGSAVSMSLRSSIIVYCIGIEKLTSCYGISMLVLGIGAFLGTSFAGILVSLTGTYEAAFLFAGCGLLVSSILLFGTAFISNIEKILKS